VSVKIIKYEQEFIMTNRPLANTFTALNLSLSLGLNLSLSIGLSWLLLSAPVTMAAESAEQQAPAVPVQVSNVKLTIIAPTIDVMATLYSRHQIQITAAVNGQLIWVAEPGTYLAKGQPVAKMDLIPLKLQLAEQQAQIERANINVKYQGRELARLEQLKLKDATSVFQIDQTRSQRDIANSNLKIAQLQIQQIEDQISRSVATAPFAGVVTERLHHAGEDISRSVLIARMLDTQNLEARLFVPLKHLPYLKLGDALTLSTSEYQLNSQVNAIIPSADQRSQTFELRITVPQSASDHWAAGQLVKVALPINKARQSLAVHRDALIIRRDGVYVVRINEDNKAERVKVIVGDGNDDWVAVKGDLKDGDQVAIRGAERLSDGQLVDINS
jgi:RND family efflux transporter MFP subunit